MLEVWQISAGKKVARMTDNREYRARIHIMVNDIESNRRLRQLHALIYRMHERDVADRLRTERQEVTEDGNAE